MVERRITRREMLERIALVGGAAALAPIDRRVQLGWRREPVGRAVRGAVGRALERGADRHAANRHRSRRPRAS